MSASSPNGLSLSGNSGKLSPLWILDSGASHHMSPDIDSFVSVNSAPSLSVTTADGTQMPLSGIGSVHTSRLSLPDVYHIPSLTLNLVSVGQLCDSSLTVLFTSTNCCVQDPRSRKVIGTGRREGGLYVLNELKVSDVAASSVDLSSFRLSHSSSDFYLWHSHLCHVSASRLKFLVSTGVLGSLDSHDISDCSGCKLAKFLALPFNKSISSSIAPFDLVHSDVWGPSPVSTKGGSRYYVSFIDDFTRYTWVYLMKRRSNFLTIFCNFRALVKTQYSSVIKYFRCDLGAEYTSNDFLSYLLMMGLFIKPPVQTLLSKMVWLKESIVISLKQLGRS